MELRPFGDIVGLSNYDVRISRCHGARWRPLAGWAHIYAFEAHLAAWLHSQLFDIIIFFNPELIRIDLIIDNDVDFLNPCTLWQYVLKYTT